MTRGRTRLEFLGGMPGERYDTLVKTLPPKSPPRNYVQKKVAFHSVTPIGANMLAGKARWDGPSPNFHE